MNQVVHCKRAAHDVYIGRPSGCWCKPAACHGDVLVKLANT